MTLVRVQGAHTRLLDHICTHARRHAECVTIYRLLPSSDACLEWASENVRREIWVRWEYFSKKPDAYWIENFRRNWRTGGTRRRKNNYVVVVRMIDVIDEGLGLSIFLGLSRSLWSSLTYSFFRGELLRPLWTASNRFAIKQSSLFICHSPYFSAAVHMTLFIRKKC